MARFKNEPQLPLNSAEHILYCIVERLEVLIEKVEALESAEEVKPKRARKAKVEE